MKNLSPICETVKHSAIRKMFALADNCKDPVNFAIGEPDFTTPENIINAANKALSAGKTHYTPNIGIYDLRAAVAAYRKQLDLSYDPVSEIMITAGGMEAIYLSMLTLIEEGDEVILCNPGWVNYYGQVQMCGGRPVMLDIRESEGFMPVPEELEAAITDRTKLFVLNSPSNPTGGVADAERLEKLAEVCVKNDIYVMADEVYHHFIYDSEGFTSIASFPGMRERTVIIDSFSKTYAMTGWRVGMAMAPEPIIANMVKFQENVAACVNTAAQYGALEALTGPQDSVAQMAAVYLERRNKLIDGLNSIPGVSCIVPKGAFYAFPNISQTGLSSEEFAMRLMKEQEVITVPGTGFGSAGEGFIRLSYATSMENILSGLDRIDRFVRSL